MITTVFGWTIKSSTAEQVTASVNDGAGKEIEVRFDKESARQFAAALLRHTGASVAIGTESQPAASPWLYQHLGFSPHPAPEPEQPSQDELRQHVEAALSAAGFDVLTAPEPEQPPARVWDYASQSSPPLLIGASLALEAFEFLLDGPESAAVGSVARMRHDEITHAWRALRNLENLLTNAYGGR